MVILFSLLIFLIGLLIGSFLNVLVDRLPISENPFRGRSRCDHCKHVLSPLDLIPLFSHVWLRGKCRYCKKKLSFYYPFVEFVTGLAFLGVFVYLGSMAALGSVSSMVILSYYLLVVSTLLVIFFTDLKSGIIPFNTVVFGVILTFLFLLFLAPNKANLFHHLFSAFGAFVAFLLLFLVTRGRGIGFGDVIYVFFMGFLLGFPKILPGLYIAFISGAIISVVLILLKKKKLRGSTIPFGPFLVGGTITCLFWGDFLLAKILPYLLLQ